MLCCIGWQRWQGGLSFTGVVFHPGQFVWKDIGSETVSWSLRTDLSCVSSAWKASDWSSRMRIVGFEALQDFIEISEASLECPVLKLDYRRKQWTEESPDWQELRTINLNKIFVWLFVCSRVLDHMTILKHNQQDHINHLDRYYNCDLTKQIIRGRSFRWFWQLIWKTILVHLFI